MARHRRKLAKRCKLHPLFYQKWILRIVKPEANKPQGRFKVMNYCKICATNKRVANRRKGNEKLYSQYAEQFPHPTTGEGIVGAGTNASQ